MIFKFLEAFKSCDMRHIFEQQAQSQLFTNIIDQQFYLYIFSQSMWKRSYRIDVKSFFKRAL